MKFTKNQLQKIIKEELEFVLVDDTEASPKVDEEIGMAVNQLQAIAATSLELSELIKSMNYVPEWGDGKITAVLDKLSSIRSYMVGKSLGQGGLNESVATPKDIMSSLTGPKNYGSRALRNLMTGDVKAAADNVMDALWIDDIWPSAQKALESALLNADPSIEGIAQAGATWLTQYRRGEFPVSF